MSLHENPNTSEEIEVMFQDAEKPRGRRTSLHYFYSGIVFHASSVFETSPDGLSTFLLSLQRHGDPRTLNDPEVAIDRFPFLDHDIQIADKGKPFSYQQIADRLDISVHRVKAAERRVVREATGVIFAYNLPRVSKLPF